MARNDDLQGCSFADILERLEAGRIGHRAAMEWLDIESYHELVEVMHLNGRRMPGHRDMIVTQETRDLLRSIIRPLPKKAATKRDA